MPKRKKSELNQTEQTEERSFEINVIDETLLVRASQFLVNRDIVDTDREETEKLVFDLSRFHAQSLQVEVDLDTEYRMFRARRTNDFLKADPKLSEWKIKARIEASPEYAAFKEGIAIVKRNVDFADLLLDLAYHKLDVLERTEQHAIATRRSTGHSIEQAFSL